VSAFGRLFFRSVLAIAVIPLESAEFNSDGLADARERVMSTPHCPKKENRLSSGCGPMVVAEHSAEALSALNRVMGWDSDGCGLRKSVFQALLIALGMIVRRELPDCVLKRCRSEEDHPAQTLLFN